LIATLIAKAQSCTFLYHTSLFGPHLINNSLFSFCASA
jgi:hypothetical protein